MERSKRPNRGQNYARWTAEARFEDEQAIKKRKTESQDEDDIGSQDAVRCSCGATTYDENDPREMVECEKCLTWQHITCETNGGDANQLPDPYACYICSQPSAEGEEDQMSNSPIKEQENMPAEDDLPKDKVRKSVITSLDSIFTTQLIPMAQREKLLNNDINAATYSIALAKDIELALFNAHGEKKSDVGAKYRERFRTLAFNLKNDKNHLLQTQIITRTVSPDALAVLSADEMLSPELRKLADQVKQESIQGSILKVDEGPRVRKTHKGEEIVENENDVLPQAREPTPEETNNQDDSTNAGTAGASIVASEQPRIVEAQYDNLDHFEEPDYSPVSPGSSDGDDDFEATMGTTPIIEEAVWKGRLTLNDVASFPIEMINLGSNNPEWAPSEWARVLLPSTQIMELKGRVAESVALPYLDRMAEFRVIGAVLITSKDVSQHNALFNHYKSREKFGVITSHTSVAKDAYLIPLGSDSQLPQVLSWASDAISTAREDHENLFLAVFVLPRSSPKSTAVANDS